MVGRTTKRMFFADDTQTTAGDQDNLEYEVEHGNKVNCSNIWWDFTVEPENADANAQGVWVLYAINTDAIDFTTPIWNTGNLADQSLAGVVIAWGVWSCSNQSPFNLHPQTTKTTRNLRREGRLGLSVRSFGITAGNLSILSSLTCNVTSI